MPELPLDHDAHSEVSVGVEGSSAFHLVADRHTFKRSGERVYQELVLVDLRARLMAQSCMPHVFVRCIAAGTHLFARNFSIPEKRRPTDLNSNAGMTFGESTGLALKAAVAPGPDWLLCVALANLSSPSLRVSLLFPAGCRLKELFQRSDLPFISYSIHQFPQSVPILAGACRFGVVCWQ